MVIVNCCKTNGHKLRATCNQSSGVWYYTVTEWVFSNIWKQHRKPHTQQHSITSQHTKIVHRLFIWALYHYFWHTHFLLLINQASGKCHDQDKQELKPFWTVCCEWCFIDVVSLISIFYTEFKSRSLELCSVRLNLLPEDGKGTGYWSIMLVL